MQKRSIEETIMEFMKTKPKTIDIIGYGSGVKKQTGYDDKMEKQIDIIATVDDSLSWHQENRKMHPNEYNSFGLEIIKPILHFGTDITYISNIPYEGNVFKIGVIDRFDFFYDLENWINFYMAGRMQKPVLLLNEDKDINKFIYKNRLNALKTALILTSDKNISEEKLFETLCSLSYIGDIRMALKFENPQKVNNIISGDYEEIKSIYSSIDDDLYLLKNGIIVPNTNRLITELPTFPKELVTYLIDNNIDVNNQTVENIQKTKEFIIKYLKKLTSNQVSLSHLKVQL